MTKDRTLPMGSISVTRNAWHRQSGIGWTRLQALVLVVALIASCDALGPVDTVVVRSESAQQIEITCTGDPRLTAQICRTWGERLIVGSPAQSQQTARLLLQYYAGKCPLRRNLFRFSGSQLRHRDWAVPRPSG